MLPGTPLWEGSPGGEKCALNLFAADQVSMKLVARTQGRMTLPRMVFPRLSGDSQSFLLEEISIRKYCVHSAATRRARGHSHQDGLRCKAVLMPTFTSLSEEASFEL